MRKKFKARDKTRECDVLIGFYVTKSHPFVFLVVGFFLEPRRSDHLVDFVFPLREDAVPR